MPPAKKLPARKKAAAKAATGKPSLKKLADAARRPAKVEVPALPVFDHVVRAKQPGQKTVLESRRLRAPKGQKHHQLKIGVPGALIASIQAHSESAEWGGALLRLADWALHELVAKGKTLESLPNEHAGIVGKPEMSDSKAMSARTIKRRKAAKQAAR